MEKIGVTNDLRFIKNPTADGLARLIDASTAGGARGVAHGRDMYWWDDFAAIHSVGAHMLGVPYLKEYDNRLYAVKSDGSYVVSAASEAAPLFKRIALRSKDRFEFNMLGAKWEAEDFLEQLEEYCRKN